MGKTSTATEAGQEGSLREGLEAAIRERVREIMEMVLEQEVESALGAPRSRRVAERNGYRHGRKPRRLTLRTGTVHIEVPRARLVSRWVPARLKRFLFGRAVREGEKESQSAANS